MSEIKHVMSNSDEMINVRLLYVNEEKNDLDWHSEKHSHSFTEFAFITSGSGKLVFDNTSIEVEKNCLIFINPHVEHCFEPNAGEKFSYLIIGVEGIIFSFDQMGSASSVHCYRCMEFRNPVADYIKKIQNEIDIQAPYHELVCQKIVELLILHLMRQDNCAMTVKPFKNIRQVSNRVKKYIDTHYCENITLQLLAEETETNKYYLSHCFTEDYDLSPINYLIAKRIEESKKLLVNTNMSISMIADNTGFSSQSYFSQSFKKYMGLTPNEYRNRNAF